MAGNEAHSTRIAIDLSCAAEQPVTGIGYAAIYQLRALLARSQPGQRYVLFATGDRTGRQTLAREFGADRPIQFVSRARLIKYYAWTRLNWPPIEWFTGRVRIAHNLCHQTPAASRAIKMVTIHDMSPFRHPETHTPRAVEVQTTLLRHAARKADCLVAVSQNCALELRELLSVPEDRVAVVPNGVHLAEFEGPLDTARLHRLRETHGIRDAYFIHLGTLEPRKNLARLLEAHHIVSSQRSDAPQLVLVGTVGWNADAILSAARSAGSNVVLPGYLSREEAVLLLRGAIACVYPSLYEGFGLPVLEAMAAHVPVITSNTTSLPEVAGDAALYIDPLDVESISHSLAGILDHPDAAQRRVTIGRERAETLSWDASAAKLASLYASLAH
ncbi:MAG: glycosyltransferase family 1 protein [Candidatus Hydrogenedentes bacterium]|nr:glycosyltransferase family 1 protein [Candidatus Hydrogenedentota bacterium]